MVAAVAAAENAFEKNLSKEWTSAACARQASSSRYERDKRGTTCVNIICHGAHCLGCVITHSTRYYQRVVAMVAAVTTEMVFGKLVKRVDECNMGALMTPRRMCVRKAATMERVRRDADPYNTVTDWYTHNFHRNVDVCAFCAMPTK